MSREQAGRHYANVAAADCNSKCGLRLQPRSTASLPVPGSVLQNTQPSYQDTEQQLGLKAKPVPKGSFTTAKDLVLKRMVRIKKRTLSGDMGIFQNLFSLLSFPLAFFPLFVVSWGWN